MAGFDNDVIYGINADFSNANAGTGASTSGQLLTDAQLWIGSSVANAGGTHINTGHLTSPGGTLTIGYSSPNITIDVSGTGSVIGVAGTANQVLANNTFGIAQTGNVTLTIPTLFIPPGNQQFNNTNAGLTQGVLSWAGGPRMHNFGTDNIFFGTSAGNGTLTGTDNIGIGLNAMSTLTSGTANMSLGANTLSAITSGANNVGMGIACLHALQTGGQNTAVGTNALNATTASGNTAIGYQSLITLGAGSFNTAIGYQAGNSYTTTESNNICIGNGVSGTLGESNVTRIGNTQTKFFATGIDGVNVGSTATVVTESGNQLGTAVITAGTGITVTPSANAITISGSSGIQTASVTLSSSQVKNLRGTPIQILAGPGTGKINFPIAYLAELIYGGTNAFTNTNANLSIIVGATASQICLNIQTPAFIIATANSFGMTNNISSGAANNLSVAAWDNAVLQVSNNGSADFGGNAANNNTLKVTIFYQVLTY